MNYKIVAARMLNVKRKKHIFFSDMECKTGLSLTKICNILSGRRPPTLTEFALLCIALGASADALLQADDTWE